MPDAKTPDIMKEIGKLWGMLADEEKQEYKEIAEQGRESMLIEFRQAEVQ